jgi:hypothetical protein
MQGSNKSSFILKQQHRELKVFRDLYQPQEKIPFEKDTTVSHTVLLITSSPGRNQWLTPRREKTGRVK